MPKNLPKIKTPLRDVPLTDVMRGLFGLKGFETKTYFHIVNNGATTINGLVNSFKRDRSTIQRALQKLTIAGLIYREQKNIMHGGYYYVYHASSLEEMKSSMKSSINKWSEAVIAWVDGLKNEVKK